MSATTTTRTAPAVQAVGRRRPDLERRPRESAGLVLALTVAYAALGYWLVVRLHVVDADTLDRFGRAQVLLHGDPSQLAAVVSERPPLPMLLLAPFTAVPALAATLVVVPVVSALLAALTLLSVHTIARRAQLGAASRTGVLLMLGLNPLVLTAATTGAEDLLWLAGGVGAWGALVAWYVTADVRFVLLAGLGFGLTVLAAPGGLTWVVTGVVAVVVVLARLGADRREVEATAMGLALPALGALVLVTGLSLLLRGEVPAWLRGGVITPSSTEGALRATLEIVVQGAPLALVVLPALLVASVARRNPWALWLAMLLAVTILTPTLGIALGVRSRAVSLDDALPVLLVAVIGGLWLARSSLSRRTSVSTGLVALLALSIPWTFAAIPRLERPGLALAVHDAIVTGRAQEGVLVADGSSGGAAVGFDDALDMARVIRAEVPAGRSVLTDASATSAVILLTGSPGSFIDLGAEPATDGASATRDPAGSADYLLLSVGSAEDRLADLFPAAAQGVDPALPLVHTNQQYSLVEVPRDDAAAPSDSAASSAAAATSGGAP